MAEPDTQDLIGKNSLTRLAVASSKRRQPRLRRFSWPAPYRALSPSSLSRHPLTKAEGEAAVGAHKRSGSASPSKGRMVARPVRARPARYLDRRLPEQYVEVQLRRIHELVDSLHQRLRAILDAFHRKSFATTGTSRRSRKSLRPIATSRYTTGRF
jgi:hypothetical protein